MYYNEYAKLLKLRSKLATASIRMVHTHSQLVISIKQFKGMDTVRECRYLFRQASKTVVVRAAVYHNYWKSVS